MAVEAAPDCVVVQPIAEAGLALLRDAGLKVYVAPAPDFSALAPKLRTAVAIITRNAGFPAHAIAAAPQLKVIASHGSGTDAIDRVAAAARGVQVLSTPGANAVSVAELTMGMILAAARRIASADRAVRAGDAGYRGRSPGLEIAGLTLGLVGFGHVARHVAPLARAFGMMTIAFSRHASDAAMDEAGLRRIAKLDDLLHAADVVSLHAAGGAGALIGERELTAMKPGALIVNTARGSLIDEEALAKALISGRLGGAALDVTVEEPLPETSPLLAAPNLILTPHLGGSTQAALDRTAVAVAGKVLEALRGQDPPGRWD